ncbi:hypothetical protein TD95_005129 [Thielaviopsis punctulata]|uniref:Pectate lyase domain-containing protein n=1 Tax=Thielaviopsis punctulata TaxID=72032 RepID=A0A0F4ZDT0_9PEZI|nr:hypothetical protein TD95_005130 [Thielaviopsis punctulata]KKA28627.1 hypothetical protein TD95_005129 [Thielaviopsis punctulata]
MSLVAGALSCANTKTNACAKAVASSSEASAFCSTVTSDSAVPSWASDCGSIKNVLKECVCQHSGSAAATTLVTATRSATQAPAETSAAQATPTSAIDSAPAASSSSPSTGKASGSTGSAIGYAAGTTGGGSGAGTTVTSCTALASALEKGGVIRINGYLKGCGVLDVPSDTSVIGVGASSGMEDGGLRVKKANNVIIQNLKMHNPPEGKDIIAVDKSTMVWVDHLALSSDGIALGDKDYYDGLVDITHASDKVTVSYCTFQNHFKVSLVGHSDNNAAEDTGFLRITYHHNYWNNIGSRAPSIRFGTAHIFNNCYNDVHTSGVHSRMGAKVLVEGNSFTNVKRAIVTDLDSKEAGFAVQKNNIFTNSDIDITQGSDFNPPYTYSVADASGICATVKSSAGTSASL